MFWSDDHGWAWIPMSLVMIAIAAILVWGVVRLVADARPPARDRPTALDILDERLARGEIDVEEHRELRAALGTGERHPAG